MTAETRRRTAARRSRARWQARLAGARRSRRQRTRRRLTSGWRRWSCGLCAVCRSRRRTCRFTSGRAPSPPSARRCRWTSEWTTSVCVLASRSFSTAPSWRSTSESSTGWWAATASARPRCSGTWPKASSACPASFTLFTSSRKSPATGAAPSRRSFRLTRSASGCCVWRRCWSMAMTRSRLKWASRSTKSTSGSRSSTLTTPRHAPRLFCLGSGSTRR
mmetsp:Transcript_23686/g.76533  ORF Transcript_23686/g.76533 Transcript_23686/m.76533 type:complete len:219 (-) Transcript_23686:1797-2453(-)